MGSAIYYSMAIELRTNNDTNETFVQDFREILKRALLNFSKKL